MPRNILATNLCALMQAHEPPFSGRQLAIAAKLDGKTVTRILKGEHAANLDTIHALASVFGLLPWQLLVPGLRPHDPPQVQLSKTEADLYMRLRKVAADLGKVRNGNGTNPK